MSAKRRRRSGRAWLPWLVFVGLALAGAAIWSVSRVPDQPLPPKLTEALEEPAPREEIRDSEKQKLQRVLEATP